MKPPASTNKTYIAMNPAVYAVPFLDVVAVDGIEQVAPQQNNLTSEQFLWAALHRCIALAGRGNS